METNLGNKVIMGSPWHQLVCITFIIYYVIHQGHYIPMTFFNNTFCSFWKLSHLKMVFKKNSPSSFPKIKIILSLCNFKGHNIKKYIYFGKHASRSYYTFKIVFQHCMKHMLDRREWMTNFVPILVKNSQWWLPMT